MHIYNVTVKLEPRAHARFLKWAERIYLPQLLEDGIIEHYTLTRLESTDDTDGPTYCLLLTFGSKTAFQLYKEKQLAGHEQMLHDEFKGSYVSFPSELGVVLTSRK